MVGLRGSICLGTDVAGPGCELAATGPLEEREEGRGAWKEGEGRRQALGLE